MYFSLCLVLFLASCGFSGVQSYEDDYAESYGARSLSAGVGHGKRNQRAGKVVSMETVNEGMEKVVALAEALAEGSTPTGKRSGTFLASAKPELATKIQARLKDAQRFAEKLKETKERES